MALVEHEVPEHELVHLLELRNENLEIVEVQIDERLARRRQARREARLPEGSRLISVMRGGAGGDRGRRRRCSEPGDQVLAILEPGKEDELRRAAARRSAPRSSARCVGFGRRSARSPSPARPARACGRSRPSGSRVQRVPSRSGFSRRSTSRARRRAGPALRRRAGAARSRCSRTAALRPRRSSTSAAS